MSLSDIAARLTALGLTKYEARALAALLIYGPMVASEVAARAGVPQPRVYDVLSSLVSKGLVMVVEGQPKTYVALDPRHSLESYIEAQRQALLRLKDEVVSMLPAELGGGGSVGVWRSEGVQGLMNMLRDAVGKAEAEVILAASDLVIDGLIEDVRMALSRGVAVTVISYGEVPELGGPAEVRSLRWRGPTLLVSDLGRAVIGAQPGPGARQASYMIDDERLLTIVIDYVYRLLSLSEVVKPLELRPGQKIAFAHVPTAIEVARRAMARGLTLTAAVEGRYVSSGGQARLSGVVSDVKSDAAHGKYTIVLRTDDGRQVRVGGLQAVEEDVEARRLVLEAQGPRGGY